MARRYKIYATFCFCSFSKLRVFLCFFFLPVRIVLKKTENVLKMPFAAACVLCRPFVSVGCLYYLRAVFSKNGYESITCCNKEPYSD